MQLTPQPPAAPAWHARRYGALGGLIALFSALGVVGWLLLR